MIERGIWKTMREWYYRLYPGDLIKWKKWRTVNIWPSFSLFFVGICTAYCEEPVRYDKYRNLRWIRRIGNKVIEGYPSRILGFSVLIFSVNVLYVVRSLAVTLFGRFWSSGCWTLEGSGSCVPWRSLGWVRLGLSIIASAFAGWCPAAPGCPQYLSILMLYWVKCIDRALLHASSCWVHWVFLLTEWQSRVIWNGR